MSCTCSVLRATLLLKVTVKESVKMKRVRLVVSRFFGMSRICAKLSRIPARTAPGCQMSRISRCSENNDNNNDNSNSSRDSSNLI